MSASIHVRKTAAALLLSLAFSTASMAVDAVSLGSLTVESKPGQPLDAVLEIDDVDLTVSPLLVRVAPPGTYLRQGVQWPEQARDLRIAKDHAAQGVRVRVIGSEGVEGSFPLLIELNAGGVVSVREYSIAAKDGAFVVTPAAEHTTVDTRAIKAAAQARAAQEAGMNGLAADGALPSIMAASSGASGASPAPVGTTAAAAAAAAEDAAPANSAAGAQEAGRPSAKRKRGRYAPTVVKEYVALNGFSADESFEIQPDMTLWSIAKLYWPAFPGVTLEQLSQAFADKNPAAFEEGDVARLVVGQKLNPPAVDDVFAVDPAAAFAALHGEKTIVPPVTQTLMDAQALSRECAEAVGRAQNEKREAGEGLAAIEKAGLDALSAWRASRSAADQALQAAPEAAQPTSETSIAADASAAPTSSAASTEPSSGQPESAEAAEPSVQSEPAPAVETAPAQSQAQSPLPSTDAPAEEAAPSDQGAAATQAADQAVEPEKSAGGMPLWVWILAAAAVIGGFLLYRRRSNGVDEEAAEKKPAEGKIAFQPKVEPASDAQLKAVAATVDAAVRNGTTAGAIGEGEYAYTRAQIEAAQAERAKAAQASPASSESLVKPFEVPADQPWLDPLSDELPPLDEDAEKNAPKGLIDISAAVEGVSLDLDVGEKTDGAAKTAVPSGSPQAEKVLPNQEERDLLNPSHWVVEEEEPPAARYVPPLEPEPMMPAPEAPAVVGVQPQPPLAQEPIGPVDSAAAPAAPAKPASPEALRSEKEAAQWQAYDAKLKLASSFIGLGALKEADELLEEVLKHGSEEQRSQAKFLIDRIAPNLKR